MMYKIVHHKIINPLIFLYTYSNLKDLIYNRYMTTIYLVYVHFTHYIYLIQIMYIIYPLNQYTI